MASLSESKLCLDCINVDFSRVPGRDDTHVLREIGSSTALSPAGTCDLCDIMVWMLDAPCNDTARNNLCLIQRDSFEAGKGEGFDYRQQDKWPHGFMKLAIPSDTTEPWGRPYYDISDRPRFATFTDPSGAGARNKRVPYCASSVIKPDRIDYPALQSWMKYCDKSHENCKPSGHPELPIRVIDCETERVVPAPANCEYTTLSYVWGKSPDDSDVSGDGALINLPPTIRDALSVTITLGYRYIWIDRYCIDQENAVEKLAQIQQMGAIYQASSLTIFAACGVGPQHGLPGAGRTPRHEQMKRTIHGREIIGLLDHPRKLVQGSMWMRRAWTYQEAILSRRRLFLTDQQAYFECRHDFLRDEIYGFGKPLYEGDSGLGLRMASGAPNQSLFRDMTFEYSRNTQIFRYISSYSKRQLTFESDRLLALLGIFRVISELKHPVFHLQGVPIITSTPAPRNCWGPQDPPPVWSITTAFMVGMTWNVKTEAQRNQDFPSWSWTAWAGKVSWGGEDDSEPPIDEIRDASEFFKGSVWVEDSIDHTRNLESYKDDRGALGLSLARAIHVESETYEITLVNIANPLEGYYTYGDEHHRHFSSGMRLCSIPAGCWATWEAESGVKSYIPFALFDSAIATTDNVSFKLLVVLYGLPERMMMGGYGFTEGKVLRPSGESYEVIGHISLFIDNVYFKHPETSELDELQVTQSMILPKLKRERIRLL